MLLAGIQAEILIGPPIKTFGDYNCGEYYLPAAARQFIV
jgi:hypothetical protein